MNAPPFRGRAKSPLHIVSDDDDSPPLGPCLFSFLPFFFFFLNFNPVRMNACAPAIQSSDSRYRTLLDARFFGFLFFLLTSSLALLPRGSVPKEPLPLPSPQSRSSAPFPGSLRNVRRIVPISVIFESFSNPFSGLLNFCPERTAPHHDSLGTRRFPIPPSESCRAVDSTLLFVGNTSSSFTVGFFL